MQHTRIALAFACWKFLLFLSLKTIKNPNRQTRQLYAYVANESSLKGCVWAHSFYKHCFYYKFATSEKIEWSVSGTHKLLVGYSDISVGIATLTSRVNQQWIISSTFIPLCWFPMKMEQGFLTSHKAEQLRREQSRNFFQPSNSSFSSSKNSYFQNKAQCETFLMKISFICMRIKNSFSYQ